MANSYYIYIMSALYFAVPTVTGQLVLGARAGAAGMVNSAIGGAAQEAGKIAGSGHGSDAVTHMMANTASVGQAAYTKSLRQSGLGLQAIQYGNQGMKEDLGSSLASTMGSLAGRQQNALAYGNQSYMGALGVDKAAAQGASDAYNTFNRSGPQPSPQLPRTPLSGAPVPQGGGHGEGLQPMGGTGSGVPGDGAGNSPIPNFNGGGSTVPGAAATGPAAAPSLQSAGQALGAIGKVAPGGIGGMLQAAGGALQKVGARAAQMAPAVTNYAAAAGAAKQTNETVGNQGMLNRQQADLDAAGFGHSGASRGYNVGSQRMAGYANFKAESDAWSAKNKFANQLSGQANALGYMLGGITAGQKPQGSAEAMGMAGMLGGSAKEAGYFADRKKADEGKGGGYWGSLQAGNNLAKAHAGDLVGRQTHLWTPVEAAKQAGQAAIETAGANFGGGGRNVNQLYSNTNSGQSSALSSGDSNRGHLFFGAGTAPASSKSTGTNQSPTGSDGKPMSMAEGVGAVTK
jgi:hypothetical protein